jgi:hypothetical protein
MPHDSTCNRNTLSLSTRKLGWVMVHAFAQTNVLKHCCGACASFMRRYCVNIERDLDVLRGGERVEKIVGLKDEPDAPAGAHLRIVTGAVQFLSEYA